MIESMQTMRIMMLTMHSTMSGVLAQMQETSADATAMGKAFDAAKNDDSFFLPPEVFENEDFKQRHETVLFAGREGDASDHFA